jgi:DNA-directed RNA polymerase subunit RPC12/RpoP
MKENCINCQKEVELEKGDIFYSIYDNFDKYKDKYWCSGCLKEVQKICEDK